MNNIDRRQLRDDWSDPDDQDSLRAIMRAEFSEETTISELQGILDCDRSYAVECAKSFEESGVCQFIVGRRGGKSRVRWLVDPRLAARIGLGISDNGISAESAGPSIFSWDDVIRTLAAQKSIDADQVVVDVKIGPLKRNLARLHGIDEQDVDIRIGA